MNHILGAHLVLQVHLGNAIRIEGFEVAGGNAVADQIGKRRSEALHPGAGDALEQNVVLGPEGGPEDGADQLDLRQADFSRAIEHALYKTSTDQDSEGTAAHGRLVQHQAELAGRRYAKGSRGGDKRPRAALFALDAWRQRG